MLSHINILDSIGKAVRRRNNSVFSSFVLPKDMFQSKHSVHIKANSQIPEYIKKYPACRKNIRLFSQSNILSPENDQFPNNDIPIDNNESLKLLKSSSEHLLSKFALHPNEQNLKKAVTAATEVGDFYFEQERSDLTLEFFENFIEQISSIIKEITTKTESSELAILLHKIGCIHAQNQSSTEALRWLDKAYEMKKRVCGESHPQVARTLNAQASVYSDTEDFTQALLLYQRAEEITREGFQDGIYNPQRVVILDNMARIYRTNGDFNGALNQYEKLLAIKTMWKNRNLCDEIDIITERLNIGDCLFHMKEFDNATKEFETVKKLLDFIDDAYFVKSTLSVVHHNIGLVEYEKKEYQPALHNFERALKLKIELVGKDNVEVGETQNCIGATKAILKENEEALQNFQEALRIFRLNSVSGDMDSKVVEVLSNIRNLKKNQQTKLF